MFISHTVRKWKFAYSGGSLATGPCVRCSGSGVLVWFQQGWVCLRTSWGEFGVDEASKWLGEVDRSFGVNLVFCWVTEKWGWGFCWGVLGIFIGEEKDWGTVCLLWALSKCDFTFTSSLSPYLTARSCWVGPRKCLVRLLELMRLQILTVTPLYSYMLYGIRS